MAFPTLPHPLLLLAFQSQTSFSPQTHNPFNFFSLLSVMEVNTATTLPAGPPTKNHSFTHHHLHSERHSHTHGHFPSKTILITVSLVTLVTVLFVIFVVLCLIRRQKSSTKNGTCKEDSRELHDTSSRLITSSTLNSSPGN